MNEVARTSGQADNNAGDNVKWDGQKKLLNSRVIFVWDLDETLIVFQSLLTGKFVSESPFPRDEDYGRRIGEAWSELILEISDNKMFFSQVCPSSNVSAVFITIDLPFVFCLLTAT